MDLEGKLNQQLGGSADEKNVDKAIELLGDVNKVIEFSFIDDDEKQKLFKLGVINILYFKQHPDNVDLVEEIIILYCRLSKSVEGKALDLIRDIFKTEIQMNTMEELRKL